ncbi:hypothetical protein FOL47_008422 [Perkinsus chesapeaki]|uniref:FAD dependent oxidoreductase domain-containing protein n=1 Tax=Perkinsus chesapeaki TaxID=330153 RepID=A0A7J6MTS7_PERCH|nr:hypothetical protein FOL47_008422 [Perkinsus chesapeaki]
MSTHRSLLDLPGGRSYWQKSTTKVDLPSAEDRLYDYIVIGAGLTGVAAAYHLGCAGGTVLVLEAGACPAWRASGRNGGHVWPSSHADSDEGGIDKLQFEMSGANAISDLTRRNKNGSIELASTNEESEAQRELFADDTASLQGVELICEDQGWLEAGLVPDEDAFGGIRQPNTFSVNPVDLTYAIAKRAADTGNVAFGFDTAVRHIATVSPSVTVEGGRKMGANKAVLVCTNAFTGELLPELRNHFTTKMSHLIAVPCSDDDTRLRECTLAAVNDTLYMSRPVPERIILGGEGASSLEEGASNLEKYLWDHSSERASDVSEVDMWSEYLCFTSDGLPLVGPLTERHGVVVCAGFNGNGLPLFYKCAEGAALYAQGKDSEVNPWLRKWARGDRYE